MSRRVVEIAPGLAGKLARSAGMVGAVRAIAELIAKRAEARAPFEWFREGIDVDSGLDDNGALARVIAKDWRSHFWEFGTIRHDARPTIRPAAQGFGRVVERRRD